MSLLSDVVEQVQYPENFFGGDFCSFNRELAIYDGDRDKAISLRNDEAFSAAVEEISKSVPDFNYKKDLLKSSFHLSPTLAPNIYKIGQKCSEKLGLKIKLDFWVYQDQFYNAMVYPPAQDELIIILTSALLENFDEEELTFVIGHEIGHYIFNHFRWNTGALFSYGHPDISSAHAVTLYQWHRDAEISADRAGLVCCENFDASVKSFIKLSSGIRHHDTLDFQLSSILDQFEELKGAIDSDGVDINDLYTSHPFGPLRVKALESFSKSETYFKLMGLDEGGEITEEEMETEIESFMNLMVPSYLHDNDEQSQIIQKFLFWAGIGVSEANGVVEQSELVALASIVSEDIYNEQNTVLTNLNRQKESPQTECCRIGAEVLTFADKITRHNIIRDLCIIALADGSLDEGEMYVLTEIAYMLQVNPVFVEEIIESTKS